MELEYASDKVKAQCTSVKAAKKLFGGDMVLATCLLARVNALENDVKSRREQWRIILQPLDESKNPFTPCDIDQISSYVRIIEITEVSKHYG